MAHCYLPTLRLAAISAVIGLILTAAGAIAWAIVAESRRPPIGSADPFWGREWDFRPTTARSRELWAVTWPDVPVPDQSDTESGWLTRWQRSLERQQEGEIGDPGFELVSWEFVRMQHGFFVPVTERWAWARRDFQGNRITITDSGNGPDSWFGRRILWQNLLAASGTGGLACGVGFLGIACARRSLRRRRNKCPQCGYPTGTAHECSECGRSDAIAT